MQAKEFLARNRDLLGLSIPEVEAIFQVILGHGVSDIAELKERFALGTELLDLRKLGACLSMADICHADTSRAPEIVYRHLELTEESRFHWRRHPQISGITRNGPLLIMTALTFSPQGDEAVTGYCEAIKRQLHAIRPYFQSKLSVINDVELDLSRLDSPLDQSLRFTANTPAILKLLIEGVYKREDVFVREVVQNSLDACLIRRMQEVRRTRLYEAQVIITILREGDMARAFRVDDNGLGMNLEDIQDTLLTIGATIANKADLVMLLQSTFSKHLIASFGIGLLSCFKVSESILVRTAKEKEVPIELTLVGISDDMRPQRSKDESVGTTVIVKFAGDGLKKADLLDSVKHYFRKMEQVPLRILELEWGQNASDLARTEISKIAINDSSHIKPREYLPPKGARAATEILGNDYSGAIWLPPGDIQAALTQPGVLEILNEGIYVTDELTGDWTASPLKACSGFINFSSGAITLQAARDGVVKDAKFRARAQHFVDESFGVIDRLIMQTMAVGKGEREFAALALTKIYDESDSAWKARILKRMDSYRVPMLGRTRLLLLGDLRLDPPAKVYFRYPKGDWNHTKFNNLLFFFNDDGFAELQAAIIAQRGETVLALTRADAKAGGGTPLVEATLIIAFCKSVGIPAVDLTTTNVIEGMDIAKPVIAKLPARVNEVVRFVDVSAFPNKISWKVGDEIWLNLAHGYVLSVYESLMSDREIDSDAIEMLDFLIELLGNRFEDGLARVIRLLTHPGEA